MNGLYVAYNASSKEGHVNGWAIIRQRPMPITRAAIKSIMKVIEEKENVTNVVPVYFYPINIKEGD